MKFKYFERLNRQIFPQKNSPLRKGKKCNYVFIHINKTGGTSVGKAIGLPTKRHLTIKEVSEIIGFEKLDEAFKFTVVRNPWDKVVSHYKYRVKTNQTLMSEKPIGFSEWVEKTYGENKDSFYYDNPRMFQPQVEWLKDASGNILVDKIIKFENLSTDFSELATILNIEKELPHLNKTNRLNYQKYYD